MPNFNIRTKKPGAGNKCYMTKAYMKGWSVCIRGKCKSTGKCDPQVDVLANCVGYACGRFNEIYNSIMGTTGMKYANLNCNAENFIERAIQLGLKILGPNEAPVPGGIMVFQKGSLSSGDGAGHVMIPEIVYSKDKVYTSESGYNSTAFWNQTRTRGSNNKWGMASSYTYRGCIVNPAVKLDPVITPTVDRDPTKDQIEVLITNLRVRSGPGTDKSVLGFSPKGFYNFYETADANGYKWYRIADGQWIASGDGWTKVYPKEEVVRKYKVGDKLKFTGTLYKDSYGNGAGKSYKNLDATVSIVSKEAKATKPYNINNGLGWVAENDLSVPTPTPPKPDHFSPGDKVTVNGVGRASSNGTGNTTVRYKNAKGIVVYYNKGAKYPYALKVNGAKSVTGWFQASSVK